MAITVFKDTTYNLSTLLEEIRRGEIALPDIQRPFVWKAAKVRDLFDSMYRGFPVGFLLLWSTGAEAGARSIGTDTKEAAPRLMIVDGQQRLTSLYAVMTGQPVVRDDFTESRIRIAFRPRDAQFEVADAAIEKDPEFISDISTLWAGGGMKKKVQSFIDRLEAAKGELDEDEEDRHWTAIDRLFDMRNYPFKIVELGSDIDEEQVAEIFVRINSEGVRLDQADFILTLMSVWWDKGRKALEEFARAAKTAPSGVASPANPFIAPSPDQLLRVAAGLAFRRGRLRSVYQVLRGKDLATGEVSAEVRERQFDALRDAQSAVLDLTNWHEFLKGIRRAGYCSHSMISSENNLLFGYLFYLIGLRTYGVDRRLLREVIARWFFMTAITGRYTGSFETRVEADLRQLEGVTGSDGFVLALDQIIETALTNDYWEIQLPSGLETSAAYSPTLFAYHASLVLLSATPLFSRLTTAELLNPSTHAPRSAIERHHLFPAKYLGTLGFDSRMRNQIANYAFVEWPDNASIGDQPPSAYFPALFGELNGEEQQKARFWHALPEGWENMEYTEFLKERRQLIANVVRIAFEKLRNGDFPSDETEQDAPPASPPTEPRWTLKDLIDADEDGTVEFKSSAFFSYKPDVPEKVVTESVIKTVAAFFNADGGTLAIGISDDHQVLGIQADLDHKGIDADRYVNALSSVLASALGAATSARARIRIEGIEEEQVCTITVSPSPEAVYAKTSKGEQVFYVRVNNSTRVLEGKDLVSFVKNKWG
ncbi:MAG: hypothetical protein DCC49_02205 [Acidobacteria bacterium]|nr:MAG: hypothetical protein DCC49_02205 [Acidobacteriota bacterium]